ncbi:MAG: HEAT repeat domain-containing protein [Planctomycetota bacterium]
MSRSLSERMLLACCLLIIIIAGGGCRGTGGDPPLPEQAIRKELFWKDVLSIPPESVPVPADPGTKQRIEELRDRLSGTPITELSPLLDSLTGIGPACVPVLAARLAGEEPEETRRNLVLALTALGDPAGAGALCSVLRDSSGQVALLAARGLGRLRVPWTIPRLIKVVGRYDVSEWLIVRVEAAASLIRFGNFSGVPFLLKVLKEHTALEENADREWGRRIRIVFEKEAACRALGALIGDDFGYSPNASYPAQERAILRMEGWWNEHRQRLWAEQPTFEDKELLTRVDWLIDGLAVFQIRTVDNARFILTSLGPPALPAIAARLTDPGFYVRLHLLEALEGMGPLLRHRAGEVRDQLQPLLRDKDPALRTQAVRTLGRIGEPALYEVLTPLLSDEDMSVRIATISALGWCGNMKASSALEPIARAPEASDERASAREALIRLGQEKYLEQLLGDLLDPALEVQAPALQALGQLGASIADFPLGGSGADRDAQARRIRTALVSPNPNAFQD